LAHYCVGDIHGHRATFERLLAKLGFSPSRDTLWLVGDLVNRGPDSLGTLRFVRSLDAAARPVLGNHDVHLIAHALGVTRADGAAAFRAIEVAPDYTSLVAWLRNQPLAISNGTHLMVHAGIAPGWTEVTAQDEASFVASCLQSDACAHLLAESYRREPGPEASRESQRFTASLKVLTRIRTCEASGALHMGYAGPADSCPPNTRPWFEFLDQRVDRHILFGHWAAAGLQRGARYTGLDTGCAWGGPLTALDMQSGELIAQASVLV